MASKMKKFLFDVGANVTYSVVVEAESKEDAEKLVYSAPLTGEPYEIRNIYPLLNRELK